MNLSLNPDPLSGDHAPSRFHAYHLAYHMRHALKTERLKRFVLHLPYLEWKLAQGETAALVADFQNLDEPPFRHIHDVLRVSAHVLDDEVEQLFIQLFAKLEPSEENSAFRNQLLTRLSHIRPVPKTGPEPDPAFVRTLTTNARLFAYAGRVEILAVSDSRDTVIWNLKTARMRVEPVFEGLKTFSLAISADGETIASVDLEGNLDLCSLSTMKRRRIRQEKVQFFQVYLSDHGEYAAVFTFLRGSHQTILVWDLNCEREPMEFPNYYFPCVIQNHLLYTGRRDGTLVVIDLLKQTLKDEIKLYDCAFDYMAVSPLGDRIITSAHDQPVTIRSLPDGVVLGQFSGTDGSAVFHSIQGDWQKALLCFDHEESAVLDLNQMEITKRWHAEELPDMLFLANDQDTFYSIHQQSGEVRYLDGKNMVSRPPVLVGLFQCFVPEMGSVATLFADGRVSLTDPRHGQTIRDFLLPDVLPTSIALVPGTSTLFIGDEIDGRVYKVDLKQGGVQEILPLGLTYSISAMAVDPVRGILHIRSIDRLLGWSLTNRTVLYDHFLPWGLETTMVMAPDGKVIVHQEEMVNEGLLHVFTPSGQNIRSFPSLGAMISCMAFSPSGKTLVLGCEGGLLREMSWPNGSIRLMENSGHRLQINALVFPNDSGHYLTFSQDKRIYFRCLGEDQPLDAFWYDEPIFSASYVPHLNRVFMATRGQGVGWFELNTFL